MNDGTQQEWDNEVRNAQADEAYEAMVADAREENDSACEKHPDATVVEEGGYTGFAGGSCYWATLSCGCTIVDEDDDVRAAY